MGCLFSMVSTLVDRFNGFYRFYRFKGVLILCEQRVFLITKNFAALSHFYEPHHPR